MGADAQISNPFSEIKLPALSICGIFVGENNCLDHGVQFYYMEERMKLGKILFHSVLL